MDEYISREELRKHLKECYDNELFDSDMRKATIGIDVYVENMPASDVQPVDRWISVEDRLPNIDERVFVYIPKPDNHYNIEIAYISEGNDDCPYWVLRDKSQFYSTRFHYISHWMPLPEPPKDGNAG